MRYVESGVYTSLKVAFEFARCKLSISVCFKHHRILFHLCDFSLPSSYLFLSFDFYLPQALLFYRTPINYLLLNLAVADMLFAAFITPNIIFSKLSSIHYPDGVIGMILCKLITSALIGWTGATSSIITLAAVTIERYYAVMYPHGNKGKLTKRKLKVCPANRSVHLT